MYKVLRLGIMDTPKNMLRTDLELDLYRFKNWWCICFLSTTSSSGELQTLEEVDYLAPLFGSSPGQDRGGSNRYGLSWTKPVATKIILTSDQLEERLRDLGDTVREGREREASLEDRVDTLYDRQITETEFFKKLFHSVVTKGGQKDIIGDE